MKDAVLRMMEDERGGEQVERPLLRTVVSIFSGVAEGVETYTKDLEGYILKATADHYNLKVGGGREFLFFSCVFLHAFLVLFFFSAFSYFSKGERDC